MFRFLFFNITFEQLFIYTVIFGGVLTLINILYWSYFFYKKIKNRRGSEKITFKSNFQKIKDKKNWKNLKNLKFSKLRAGFVLLSFIGFALVIYALNLMFNTRPVLLAATPENGSTWNDLTKPIYFEFDRPIDPKKVTFKIIPEVEGEFKYPKSFEKLSFTRKIEFYPKANFEPDTRVYLLVGGFNSLVGNHERYAHEANIETYKLPEVVETPSGLEEEVLLENEFKFKFDIEPEEYINIDFEFEPYIEFDKKQNGSEFVVTPKSPLAQATQYKLKALRSYKIIDLQTKEVISASNPEPLREVSFATVKAPENKNFTPSGSGVFVDSEIKFEFSQPMQPDSVLQNLSVTPELKFTPEWSENNKVLVLKKEKNLEFDKEYIVKLKAGTLGKSNTLLEKDLEYKFKTIGAAKVSRVVPTNGSGGQALGTQIKVTFDQAVDKSSAQSKFTINPKIEGSFSWDGNTMIFKPSENLKYDTKYTYTISEGVKALKGQDTQRAATYSFTTLSQTVTLNVPLYKQKYRFSCNLTATSMVLAFKGISRSQDDIYGAISKDSTPKDKSAGTWGDPDAGYVGQLDGPDGYGVHWGPIANYINSQGVSAEVRRNISASTLAKELEQGRPSIVWVWNTAVGPTWEKWTTPGGKSVSGLSGMHSYVVIGFVGSADNPSSIIINDPWGNKRTLTTSRFNYLWGFYGNTAVIIK